ncbi:DUF835 domain-containing protein [Thermococcus thioreducens]|uniref:DUF835 domain-containing protein n=1 Tax=Thermococcus thioreducens TaxID=277988 RepID=A0A0Q2S661_9EURY|nr:DUF835 domain-containing protein [Thermococcus thioreducens]ASJ13039.1 hypothetical protein A3L14_09140 [Thermococcus thioreducens]KQH82915.1 hypothetical protein AMR53_03165 [Thermococcus thioreducens]SEV82018.1 Protein of unknown function [Thermococcus thioreducens]
MEIYNPPGLVAGLIILSVSVVAAYRAYGYLKTLETPISRRLAYLALLSSVFSIVGSVGTIIESGTGLRAWWVMATFFTLSYVTILTAIFTYLRLLHQIGQGKVPEIPEIPSGTFPAPKEEQEGTPLPVGGFTVQVSELSKIKPLCRLATAVLYAGRSLEPKGCPSFDKVVWITRIGAPGSVDPSKLHVLQGEIMRFISENGSGALVIIDGVEHLLLYNDFRSLMKFLTTLRDYMVLTGSTLIVAIDEGSFSETQLSILRRELPRIDIERVLTEAEEITLFGALSRDNLEARKEENPRGQ